jgi:hypothetical protein
MFGYNVLMDRKERAKRVLEEALELAQSEGVEIEHVRKQTEYVYSRDAGEPCKEAGDLLFCIFAWCYAVRQDPFVLLGLCLTDAERPKRMAEIRRKVTAKNEAGLTIARGQP